MTLKEEFLKITSYEEYDKIRNHFRNLDIQDKEVIEHLNQLYPKFDSSDFDKGIIVEVYEHKQN